MATDWQMNEDGNIVLESGDTTIIEDAETVRQRLEIKLKTFKGTWFLDVTFGIPYYESILGANPNPIVLDGIFVEAILDTPGVSRLAEPISYDHDYTNRVTGISFTAITTEGESVPFELELA